MAKDTDEKIGAGSQKNWHGLKYKNPLKNYRVYEMPTGDQLPPHYKLGFLSQEKPKHRLPLEPKYHDKTHYKYYWNLSCLPLPHPQINYEQ